MKEYILLKSSCESAFMKFKINLCPDLLTVATLDGSGDRRKGFLGAGDILVLGVTSVFSL